MSKNKIAPRSGNNRGDPPRPDTNHTDSAGDNGGIPDYDNPPEEQFENISQESDGVDQQVFDLDAQNKLSKSQMLYMVDKRHPRHIETLENGKKTKPLLFSICKSKTGFPSCKTDKRRSDFENYGAGTVMYFQLLKYFFWIFLLLFTCSIPSMAIYYSGNTSSYLSDFKSFISLVSIGNMAQDENACGIETFNKQIDRAPGNIFNLECKIGNLNRILQFGQMRSYDQKNCDELGEPSASEDDFEFEPATCSINQWTDDQASIIEKSFDQQCLGKKSCQLPISLRNTPYSSKCQVAGATQDSWKYALTAECVVNEIELFGRPAWTIKTKSAAILIVILDLLVAFIMWMSLVILKPIMLVTEQEIDDNTIMPPDFTVIMICEKTKTPIEVLSAKYWDWARIVLENAGKNEEYLNQSTNLEDEYQNSIANIDLGLSNYKYLGGMEKVGKFLQLRKKEIFKKQKVTAHRKREAIQAKIEKLNTKILEEYAKVEEVKEKSKSRAIYAFLQFQSMNGKDKFQKTVKLGCCTRGWYIFLYCICCKCLECTACGRANRAKYESIRHIYFEGKWPRFRQDVPDPTLIQWPNLGVSKMSRSCRGVLIYVISIILMAVSFSGVMYAISQKNELDKNKFNANACGGIPLTFGEADSAYAGGQFEVVDCYCYQQMKVIYNEIIDIKFANGDKPCQTWLTSFTAQNTILIGISVGISVIVTILRVVIRKLTMFEAHHTLTSYLSSTTTKLWIVQFVGSAVVLMLINANLPTVARFLPPSFPLLRGSYKDFSTDWYAAVGTTIAFSTFINSLATTSQISGYFIKGFKRCCDQKCLCNPKRTFKLVQSEYEELYMGGEQQFETRYSQLVAFTMVIMLFGTAMPLLYLAGFVLTGSLYWSSKCLFLRYYRNPPLYGLELALRVRSILEWSVLIHLVFGLYMLTTPGVLIVPRSIHSIDKKQPLQRLVLQVGRIMHEVLGVNQNRFTSEPGVLYLVGTLGFIVLFLLEKTTGVVSSILNAECCCLRKYMPQSQGAHSSNLFAEIRPEAIQAEIQQAIGFIKQNEEYVNSYEVTQEEEMLFERYNTHLDNKANSLKQLAREQVRKLEQSSRDGPRSNRNVNQSNSLQRSETMHNKRTLVENQHKLQTRLNSLHSYNVFDHPSYVAAQLTDRKYKKFKNSGRTMPNSPLKESTPNNQTPNKRPSLKHYQDQELEMEDV